LLEKKRPYWGKRETFSERKGGKRPLPHCPTKENWTGNAQRLPGKKGKVLYSLKRKENFQWGEKKMSISKKIPAKVRGADECSIEEGKKPLRL